MAFICKRLGTNCQNQPEVHIVTQALRQSAWLQPRRVLLKAEAIVAPDALVAYLGRHGTDDDILERRECELAYHNQLMVLGWSMLAESACRSPPPR